MQRRMSNESLRRIHEMDQQAAAINAGDKGEFSTLDDQCLDYMQKLLDVECQNIILMNL